MELYRISVIKKIIVGFCGIIIGIVFCPARHVPENALDLR